MKRWSSIVLMLFALCVALPRPSSAQSESEGKRKVTNRITPEYPDMARRMNLRGVVKVDVLVGSNGLVKNVDIKGGHPVLAQAAVVAVRKWKWEPSSHETTEPIEVRFDPQ